MDGNTAEGITQTTGNTMIDAAVLSHVLAAGESGITTGDVLAAAITIFVFIVVPLLVWAVRSLINEGKRRAVDSLNMAGSRKATEEVRDLLQKHVEKEEAQIVEIREDVAGLKAIIRLGGHSNGSSGR